MGPLGIPVISAALCPASPRREGSQVWPEYTIVLFH